MSLIQRENNVAMVKADAWGSAVVPTNDDVVFVKAHTPPKGARKIITNEDEFGRGMASEGQVLEFEAQSGSMSLRVYWQGLEKILYSLMGEYSGLDIDDTSSNPGIAYRHTFSMAKVAPAVKHTIAWQEGTEIKAVNTAKVISGTLAYADGLNLDINYMGDRVTVATDQLADGGLAWAADTMDAFTGTTVGQGIFKLSNASVYVQDAGSAFTEDNKLFPSGCDLAITRGFEALPVTAGSEAIVEPIEKTAPAFELTLTFPKKEAATASFLKYFTDRAYKKVKVIYDTTADDKIGATGMKYELGLYFPKMFIMEAPDFAADSPIPTTIKLKALMATVDDADFNNSRVPYITLQNGVADTAVKLALGIS